MRVNNDDVMSRHSSMCARETISCVGYCCRSTYLILVVFCTLPQLALTVQCSTKTIRFTLTHIQIRCQSIRFEQNRAQCAVLKAIGVRDVDNVDANRLMQIFNYKFWFAFNRLFVSIGCSSITNSKMFRLLVNISLIFFLHLTFGDDMRFRDDLNEGNECLVTRSDASGTCQLLENCPTAIEELKNGGRPAHCGWKGFDEIVCCLNPVTEQTKPMRSDSRSARSKCGKYFIF